MKKTFSMDSGNSWQIYLNKPVAQLLGVSENDCSMLLEVKNKTLHVRHIQGEELEKYKNFLVKKLIKRGSGYGLNFPLPILELLDIDPEKNEADIVVEGAELIIKRAEN